MELGHSAGTGCRFHSRGDVRADGLRHTRRTWDGTFGEEHRVRVRCRMLSGRQQWRLHVGRWGGGRLQNKGSSVCGGLRLLLGLGYLLCGCHGNPRSHRVLGSQTMSVLPRGPWALGSSCFWMFRAERAPCGATVLNSPRDVSHHTCPLRLLGRASAGLETVMLGAF